MDLWHRSSVSLWPRLTLVFLDVLTLPRVVLLFASIAPFCLFCGDNIITGRRRERVDDDDDDEPPDDDGSDVGSASVGKSSSKSGCTY